MSQFRDAHDRFRESGTQLLAISPDSIYAHQAFLEELKAPFPLLSDLAREAAMDYGVLKFGIDSRGFRGAVVRSVFVVDQAGMVRYRYNSQDPAQVPDVEEVLAAVRVVVETE